MSRDNEKINDNHKVIDINQKRKSDFMIFDSLVEEEKWMKRVKEECLRECMKEGKS